MRPSRRVAPLPGLQLRPGVDNRRDYRMAWADHRELDNDAELRRVLRPPLGRGFARFSELLTAVGCGCTFSS